MGRVVKHQLIGLTALVLLVALLSGVVSASGKVGSKTATVKPQTTAPAAVSASTSSTGTLTWYGSVEGMVYEDINCDGSGDKLLDGVIVSIYSVAKDGSLTFIGSMPTGAEKNLPPYFYAPPIGWSHGWVGWNKLDANQPHVLIAEAPTGYVLVNPADGTVHLSAGCWRKGTFVLARESTLKVIKFVDLNEDGVMNGGEVGLPNVTIIVDGGAQSGATGPDGSIIFGVTSGDHTVTVDESTAPGYYPTGPTTKTVTVPCGGQGVEYFGNAPYGSISGHKWNDTDRSGDHQQGEPGVGGVTIKLAGTTTGGEVVNKETTTAADGSYSFTELKAGTYTVSEVVPKGMKNTSPVSLDVTLEPGQIVTDKDFNNANTGGKIQGYKFKDMNENGVMDEGEVGIPDVRITLDGDADEARTNAAGYFSFSVEPGSHTVAVDESTAEGYYPTTETSFTETVTLDEVKTVYFGNAPDGSISGHKWNDKNQNAIYDTGDLPVAGMTVKLSGTTSLDNKKVSLSTTTGTDGSYSFTGLQAGKYTVSEVMPDDMQAVSDESVDVTLSVGEVVTDIDFFNTTKSSTPTPKSSTPASTTAATPSSTSPSAQASTSPTAAATPTTTAAATPTSSTLPYTGMNKLPVSASAWLATGMGLLLLGTGIVRRRRQLDWLSRLAAAVPGRKWK
jgi:uncharacterized protein (DUF2141 family)